MDTGRSVAGAYKDPVTVLLRPCEIRSDRRGYNDGMYAALLTMHAWVRWAVVLTGLVAVTRAAAAGPMWTRADTRVGRFFVGAVDLQMTLGLVLYLAVSPLTRAALANVGAAMHDKVLRFWAIEHITGMLIGVTLVHIGHVRTRRLADGASRHRAALRWFGAGLLAILITMPWPFLPYGRPLLRW